MPHYPKATGKGHLKGTCIRDGRPLSANAPPRPRFRRRQRGADPTRVARKNGASRVGTWRRRHSGRHPAGALGQLGTGRPPLRRRRSPEPPCQGRPVSGLPRRFPARVRVCASGARARGACHRPCAGFGAEVTYFVAVRPVCGVVKGPRSQLGRRRCSARCTAAGRGVAPDQAPAWWSPRAPAGVDGAPVGTVEHFGGAQSSAPPPSTTRKDGRAAGGRRASRAARLGFTRTIGAGGSSWAAP